MVRQLEAPVSNAVLNTMATSGAALILVVELVQFMFISFLVLSRLCPKAPHRDENGLLVARKNKFSVEVWMMKVVSLNQSLLDIFDFF